MTEEITNTPLVDDEVSSDDKLWAMLSWIPWFGMFFAIIALLVEPHKDRAFVRYHAVQGIAGAVVLVIGSIVLGWVPVVQCFVPILALITIYPALKAYDGEWLEIPYLTDFCKGQGWI